MKVFALKGRSECGKTQTLTLLYLMLIEMGYENVLSRPISNVDFIAILDKPEAKKTTNVTVKKGVEGVALMEEPFKINTVAIREVNPPVFIVPADTEEENTTVNLPGTDAVEIYNTQARVYKRVGIVTSDNDAELLKVHLEELRNRGCGVVVCPCGLKGKTTAVIKSYWSELVTKTVFDKGNDSDRTNANANDAATLIRIIAEYTKDPHRDADNPKPFKWDINWNKDFSQKILDKLDVKSISVNNYKNFDAEIFVPQPQPANSKVNVIRNTGQIPFNNRYGGKISLFFGTSRSLSGSNSFDNYFNDVLDEKTGELKTGICTVQIPPGHIQGNLERPRQFWFIKFPENKDEHVSIQNITTLSQADFIKQIVEDVDLRTNKTAIIFVHGYNTSFADAARRAAQIVWDLPFYGTPAFFSWPSNGEKTVEYFKDDENAVSSQNYLLEFIEFFIRETKVEKLHLIAHSMGSKVLSMSLTKLSNKADLAEKLKIIDQVVFGAADIGQSDFTQNILPVLKDIGKRRTLYASDKDLALKLSQVLRMNLPRLGEAGDFLYVANALDTVDASNVKSDLLGHAYIFDTKELLNDLYYLLDKGLDPQNRRLQGEKKNDLTYWLFPE